jgi:hypothetical protein
MFRKGMVRVGYHSRPAFIIIGAQKSGTSSLHVYLSHHPNIKPATEKEIHFFDKDDAFNKGLSWYHSHFPLPYELNRNEITFEATPSYLYRLSVANRIYNYDPKIKLIALLRNPVDRAYSQWNMYRTLLKERPHFLFRVSRNSNAEVRQWVDKILADDSYPSFDEAVLEELDMVFAGDPNPEPSYIRRGLYYEHLKRFLNLFERDQLLVLDSALLKNKPSKVLNKIIRFLGVSPYAWNSDKLSVTYNKRTYQQNMSESTRTTLREFYEPYNKNLYELLGIDFDWK